ncbi:MAG: hypothetical protein IKS31_10860 [Clostridia bacterium]|nr:hypothetical protein [Clostridia bacterium]
MNIALIGQDIPALLPSLLADLFFAQKTAASVRLHEKNEAMRDLLEGYGRAVCARAGLGGVKACASLADALENADCVIYAGDPMAASRFRMDREALSGPEESDPGLTDQARVLGGLGGLMHTLRQGDAILTLCGAMRDRCPDALVISLGEPVARTTAIFAAQGFRAWGLTGGWRKGPGGLAWLLNLIGAKTEDTEAEAAGLPHFCFLTALRDRKSGRNLLSAMEAAVRDGKAGRLARRWLDMLGAVAVGSVPDHASLMPAQPDYMPDPDPVLSEPVEKRKERILRMNTVREKGLTDPEGAASQLLLLSGAPASRPVQLAAALLEKKDLDLDAAVRVNRSGAVRNLPRKAVVEAPLRLRAGEEQPLPVTLPGSLAELCLDIDEAGRLAAAAAAGDRAALRESIEIDPALAGLDRLYCLDAARAMIDLHSDILSRWDETEEDD